jgi:hydroxysqualene dehydroxylase
MRPRLAVVGAGWAGLAAAVRATQAGAAVTVYEMSHQAGGRARTMKLGEEAFDNGQHILIGAYVRTLALMRDVGADAESLLLRTPLALRFPDGMGLALQPGAPHWSLLKGIASFKGCTVADRLSLLWHASRWAMMGFRCDAHLTVGQLCAGLAPRVRELLVDPLCVAAMNTHAHEASATVFLRVLHDALLSGAGSADLLLPRQPLSHLLPTPAQHWLHEHGANWRAGQRVQSIERTESSWRLDGEDFDAVVLACSSQEAARLVATIAPEWAQDTMALQFEPIVTVYVQAPGARLHSPITALRAGPQSPAQFVFDLGALGGSPGRLACVVSGASAWIDRGMETLNDMTLRQLRDDFPAGSWPAPPRCCAASPRSAPPFAARPRCAGRQPCSHPASPQQATTWTAPTPPRWRAQCARVNRLQQSCFRDAKCSFTRSRRDDDFTHSTQ